MPTSGELVVNDFDYLVFVFMFASSGFGHGINSKSYIKSEINSYLGIILSDF